MRRSSCCLDIPHRDNGLLFRGGDIPDRNLVRVDRVPEKRLRAGRPNSSRDHIREVRNDPTGQLCSVSREEGIAADYYSADHYPCKDAENRVANEPRQIMSY